MFCCDKGHPEVAYTTKFCPMCDLNDQLDTANNDLDCLRDDLEIAQERIKELEKDFDTDHENPNINEDDPKRGDR